MDYGGEDAIRAALALRRWAVVGCSPDPARDSHRIAALLIDRGYDVVPVNPTCEEVLGRRAFPDVRAASAEGRIDVVDIFRRSEAAGAHVDEAIEAGAGAGWMQLGGIDHEAAERATAAGLTVVMNRCPAIELPRLGISGPATLS
jgi:predicted CoA-binding protein